MKRIMLLTAAAALLCAGSASAKVFVNKKELKDIKKVAIVTVAIDNVARINPTEQNEQFLRDVVAYGLEVYTEGVKSLGRWELVPAPDTSGLEALAKDLSSSPITDKVMNELADKNALPGKVAGQTMMALAWATMRKDTAKVEELKTKLFADTLKEAQGGLDAERADMVWDQSLAGLPHWIIRDGNPKEMSGMVATIFERALKEYCAANGLDGVILVHFKSEVGDRTKADISVIVGDARVLSSIKLNPGFMLFNKNGGYAATNGNTRMDDLAPMKLAVPIYKGVRTDSKKMAGKGLIEDVKLDLPDQNGKNLESFKDLVKNSADKMMKDFNKRLPK